MVGWSSAYLKMIRLYGVLKAQGMSHEHQTPQIELISKESIVVSVTMRRVTDDGVSQMCTMASKLVPATGVRLELHQAISRGLIPTHRARYFTGLEPCPAADRVP